MLHNDGAYTIYYIEGLWRSERRETKSSWMRVDFGWDLDPPHKDCLSANGDCWQKTGVNGTFSEKHARKLAAKLQRMTRQGMLPQHIPSRIVAWRISRMVIMQQRNVVQEFP